MVGRRSNWPTSMAGQRALHRRRPPGSRGGDGHPGTPARATGRALDWAERTIRTEAEPTAGTRLHYGRGMLEFVSGRHDAALRAFQTAERLCGYCSARRTRSQCGCARTSCRRSPAPAKRWRVEQALADMEQPGRERGEIRIAEASLRVAQHDPQAVTVGLLDGLGTASERVLLGCRGAPGRGDRARRAARCGRRLRRALERRARSGRSRESALPVPGRRRRSALPAPLARHRPCRADQRSTDRPGPGGRDGICAGTMVLLPGGDSRSARPRSGCRLPAHQALRAGDRGRDVPVGEHGQDRHGHVDDKLGVHRRSRGCRTGACPRPPAPSSHGPETGPEAERPAV